MSFLTRVAVPSRIRHSRLADQLPRTELRQLDRIATLIDVEDGEQIIAESTPGRECFVVVDGEFAVRGPEISATVGSGEVAGELALLTGRRRNASVVAASDASVYVMHPREFATLLSEAPTFRSEVVAAASSRLGAEPVRLPAQFVRPKRSDALGEEAWSTRLAGIPAWKV